MRRVLVPLLVGLVLVPSAWLAWHSRDAPHLGLFHDDSLFWVTARSLAGGGGYRIQSLPGEPYQTKYPPLYPLLLAAVWKLNPVISGQPPTGRALLLAGAGGLPAGGPRCLSRPGGRTERRLGPLRGAGAQPLLRAVRDQPALRAALHVPLAGGAGADRARPRAFTRCRPGSCRGAGGLGRLPDALHRSGAPRRRSARLPDRETVPPGGRLRSGHAAGSRRLAAVDACAPSGATRRGGPLLHRLPGLLGSRRNCPKPRRGAVEEPGQPAFVNRRDVRVRPGGFLRRQEPGARPGGGGDRGHGATLAALRRHRVRVVHGGLPARAAPLALSLRISASSCRSSPYCWPVSRPSCCGSRASCERLS